MTKDKQRAPTMRAELTVNLIKRLLIHKPPTGYDAQGKLIYTEDPTCKGYIVFDTSRDAPPGFAIKVAGKKTYVIRRKVNGKSIMPTVGNFTDFSDIKQARERAAELAREMVTTGRNPNAARRSAIASELTLAQAMALYREHMVTRTQRTAKVETLRVFDRVVKNHEQWGWGRKKISEISAKEVINKFKEGQDKPTANEQAFRWASRAVEWCIENEKMAAALEKRAATLNANPFYTLVVNSMYRSRVQLDQARQEQGKRNPLRPSSDLGKFLEVAWSKKGTNDNLTGIHYLMLMLLWGCRKSEHAPMVWGELLKEHGEAGTGRNTTSHVMFEHPDWGPYIFFYKTKNGRSHRLPLTPMALELMKRRQVAAAQEVIKRGFASKSRPFVFPARSRLSKTGHYSDATALLDDLREEIGVEKLTRHDLRRSFGSMMTTLDVPEAIKRRFLNHADSQVTDTYTQAEWALLREWMAKIEQAILMKAPNVYNSLRPADHPPLPAPEPHVCRPPKSRTCRPSKLESPEMKADQA